MADFKDIIQRLTALDELDNNTDFPISLVDPPPPETPYLESVLEAQKAFSKNNVQAKKAEKAEILSLAKTHFKNTRNEKDKLGMPRNEAYVHMIQLADKALTGNISKDQENEIRSKLNQFDTMHKAAKWRPGIGQDLTPVDDFVVQFVKELEELNITATVPFTTSPTPIEDGITPKLPGSPIAKPTPPPPTFSEIIASKVEALKTIPGSTPTTAREPSMVRDDGGLDYSVIKANQKISNIIAEIGANSRRLKPGSPVAEQFGSVARPTDGT